MSEKVSRIIRSDAFIASETAKWADVIKSAGVTAS